MKHPKLNKPVYDTFARVDVGVFGAPCGDIQVLCETIAKQLTGKRIIYVDAEHKAFDNPEHTNVRHSAFEAEWLDHGMGFDYRFRKHLAYREDAPRSLEWLNPESDADLALVNANHFEVANTILYWHPSKQKSVRKRIGHCANCRLVLTDSLNTIPEDIRGMLPVDVTSCSATDYKRILQLMNALCPSPELKGVVLAGGESRRMGTDKTQLELHGKPQYLHQIDRLSAVVTSPMLSLRSEQPHFNYDQILTDRFTGLGPFGAILSAFMADPGAAWLVLAADLPGVDDAALRSLIEARDPSKLATAFLNPVTGFPDPLCTIYEPKAYRRMLHFLSRGVSCPRKVLINSDIHVVEPEKSEWLTNLNTPEDLEAFRQHQRSGSA